LSFESWDDIFDDNDANVLFKSFLSTYLRLFYASFPLKFHRKNNNSTPGLPLLYKFNAILKGLYLLSQKYNNSKIKNVSKPSVNHYLKMFLKLNDLIIMIYFPPLIIKSHLHGKLQKLLQEGLI
jgi:hypothetical protein